MSYRGEPRPRGMFWRDCPSGTQLPGMAAGVAAPELLAGDLASAAGVLYRCTSPTPGSATWEAVPTAPVSLAAFGPFYKDSVTADTANQTMVLYAVPGIAMPRAGVVRGITVALDAAVAGAAQSITVVPTIDGDPVAGLSVVFTQAGGETTGSDFDSTGVGTFAAGDLIGAEVSAGTITNTGDVNPTAFVLVSFDP